MHREALRQILQQDVVPKILVFGELSLEHDILGEASEIAPEGPVPCLRVLREEVRLGGAGEAAQLLAGLGARVVPISLIGQDEEARLVRRLMDSGSIDSSGLISIPHYRTRVVMRFAGRSVTPLFFPLLRAEWPGCQNAVQSAVQTVCLRKIRSLFEERATLLLLPGLTSTLPLTWVPEIMESCRQHKASIIAAGCKSLPLSAYRGTRCLIIGEDHLHSLIEGKDLSSPGAQQLVAEIVDQNELECVVVPTEKHGLLWFARGRGVGILEWGRLAGKIYPNRLNTLLAVAAFIYSLDGDWPLAWELLQLMDAIGFSPWSPTPEGHTRVFTRKDLVAALTEAGATPNRKVLTIRELEEHLANQEFPRQSVVFAGGNFDVLRPGHMAALQWAKTLGRYLVVGVRSDRCLQAHGGRAGEHVPQAERAGMVASLDWVDFVIVSDDPTFSDVLGLLRPQVVVKGVEFPWDTTIGWQIVELYGGRIVTAPLVAPRLAQRLAISTQEPSCKPRTQPDCDNEAPTILRFPSAA